MASRLCNKCKIVHPKPWDKNCKNSVGAENTVDDSMATGQGEVQMNNHEEGHRGARP